MRAALTECVQTRRVQGFGQIRRGAVSVGAFSQGALVMLVSVADTGALARNLWLPVLLMAVGAVGMYGTVRLTPER